MLNYIIWTYQNTVLCLEKIALRTRTLRTHHASCCCGFCRAELRISSTVSKTHVLLRPVGERNHAEVAGRTVLCSTIPIHLRQSLQRHGRVGGRGAASCRACSRAIESNWTGDERHSAQLHATAGVGRVATSTPSDRAFTVGYGRRGSRHFASRKSP